MSNKEKYMNLIEKEVASFSVIEDYDHYYFVESLMNIIGWKRCAMRNATEKEEDRIMKETHSECLSYDMRTLEFMARW